MLSMKELELPKLPISIKKDCYYYQNVKECFEKYQEDIKCIDDVPPEYKNKIEENCSGILESIKSYYNSDIVCAEKNIEEILKKYKDSPFFVAPLNENYAFRGTAPEKLRTNGASDRFYGELFAKQMMEAEIYFFRARKSTNRLKREDMLHIPFDERGKIETQRFSIPGTPCMYFSTTTIGNWLELDRPSLCELQISAYELPNDLKILNLCIDKTYIDGIKQDYKTKEDKEKLLNSLELYPLLIATSYNIEEPNRKFKSEYIISQLLMQAAKRMEIDGIAYMSKKIMDYCAYPYAVNLALIMTCDNNIEQKYWKRISEIKLTEPFCAYDIPSDFKIERCKTFINKFYSGPSYGKAYEEMHIPENDHFLYRESVFYDFDEFLWEKPKESCF